MLIPKKVTIFLTLFLLIITLTTVKPNPSEDYTRLVYKGCSKQTLPDPSGSLTGSLTTLTSSLIQRSTSAKFYKTTTSTISGLYQCRGDLSNNECFTCVSKLPQVITEQCGRITVPAARVQLVGCYMLYEVSGYTQISGLQMLYKVCNPTNVAGSGFEMRRDTALQVMQNGLGSGGGFYKTTYQGVFVLGQCQGDLGVSDCGLCVKSAVEKAQVECGSSLSGELYLHKCFISYGYFPNGVPTKSAGFYGGGGGGGGADSGPGQNTGKTVAIIVGGTAGLGFLVILALFLKGLRKKDDDY